jgi:hypothetical protein
LNLTATLRTPVVVNVGSQPIKIAVGTTLGDTWQTYLDANAPKEFATPADAINYLKKSANTVLTNPTARTGLSGFGTVLHLLNEHVPLASRGIVVGGQTVGDLHIVRNALSGVIMGISVGVSHHASATEATAKQRTPDHMQTIRISDNTIACSCNDVATKNARFGIFVGNANSLDIQCNRVTLAAAGVTAVQPADAIRVVGYLGPKAVIRDNHVTGFAMGIRVVVLTGSGPGVPTPTRFQGQRTEDFDTAILAPLRTGSQWLVVDNVIEGASTSPPLGPFWPTIPEPNVTPTVQPPVVPEYIQAVACLLANNVAT